MVGHQVFVLTITSLPPTLKCSSLPLHSWCNSLRLHSAVHILQETLLGSPSLALIFQYSLL